MRMGDGNGQGNMGMPGLENAPCGVKLCVANIVKHHLDEITSGEIDDMKQEFMDDKEGAMVEMHCKMMAVIHHCHKKYMNQENPQDPQNCEQQLGDLKQEVKAEMMEKFGDCMMEHAAEANENAERQAVSSEESGSASDQARSAESAGNSAESGSGQARSVESAESSESGSGQVRSAESSGNSAESAESAQVRSAESAESAGNSAESGSGQARSAESPESPESAESAQTV